jgi:hypothetical protein
MLPCLTWHSSTVRERKTLFVVEPAEVEVVDDTEDTGLRGERDTPPAAPGAE